MYKAIYKGSTGGFKSYTFTTNGGWADALDLALSQQTMFEIESKSTISYTLIKLELIG